MVTPSRLIVVVVFVTWNIAPIFEVRVPPVMVNVEAPLLASPLID